MPGMVRLEALESALANPFFYVRETRRSPLENIVPTEYDANILPPHFRTRRAVIRLAQSKHTGQPIISTNVIAQDELLVNTLPSL